MLSFIATISPFVVRQFHQILSYRETLKAKKKVLIARQQLHKNVPKSCSSKPYRPLSFVHKKPHPVCHTSVATEVKQQGYYTYGLS